MAFEVAKSYQTEIFIVHSTVLQFSPRSMDIGRTANENMYIVYSPSMLLAYMINYQRYNYETYVCLFHVHVNRLLWIALQSYIKLFSPQSKEYTNSPWGGLEQKQIMQIHFCLFFAHQLSKSTDSCLFFLTNEFLSPNWVNFWYFFTFHNLYMGRYWDNSKYKYVFFFFLPI